MNTVEEPKKKRWNGADALLILLVIGALLAIVFYVQYRRSAEEETQDLRCVLRVKGVEATLLEAQGGVLIPVGSAVRNENGTVRLGTVRGVKVLEHKRLLLRDGEAMTVTDDGLMDLEIEVRMQGILKGKDGWRVKDLRIAAGSRGSFRFGNYYATGVEILSVEVLGAG